MMEMLPLGPPVVGSALAYLHAGLGPSGNTRVAIIKKKNLTSVHTLQYSVTRIANCTGNKWQVEIIQFYPFHLQNSPKSRTYSIFTHS